MRKYILAISRIYYLLKKKNAEKICMVAEDNNVYAFLVMTNLIKPVISCSTRIRILGRIIFI